MVVCTVAPHLSHSSPCHRVHLLGRLSRDDEITSHPSIRLSVVVGSGIIIRFACPVSLQVLARYLTSQSTLPLTSLALSLSVGDTYWIIMLRVFPAQLRAGSPLLCSVRCAQ